MFTWIVPLMGGDSGVRFWHHTFLWFFVAFIIVHVYLAFYHDYIEGRGTVSSIIGGWKFDRVESGQAAKKDRKERRDGAAGGFGQKIVVHGYYSRSLFRHTQSDCREEGSGTRAARS
jgi:hypothetical protein